MVETGGWKNKRANDQKGLSEFIKERFLNLLKRASSGVMGQKESGRRKLREGGAHNSLASLFRDDWEVKKVRSRETGVGPGVCLKGKKRWVGPCCRFTRYFKRGGILRFSTRSNKNGEKWELRGKKRARSCQKKGGKLKAKAQKR